MRLTRSSQLLLFIFFSILTFNLSGQEIPDMHSMPALVSEEVMQTYKDKLTEMDDPKASLHAHAVCQLLVDEISEIGSFDRPEQSLAALGPGCSNFEVTYNGFTPEAQAAFQYAVDLWSHFLQTDVTIRVNANFLPLAPGVLGAAGPVFVWRDAPGLIPGTWYGEALADKLFGNDLSGPGTPDIIANFSSNFTWYYGIDGNPPPGTFDFVTVVMHELGHGLGFFGSANAIPAPVLGVYGFGTPAFPVIYDRFTEDGSGVKTLSIAPPGVVSPALGAHFQSDDLFFNGPLTIAGNKGNPSKIYAPQIFRGGSSYSHWNESSYPPGHENSLMTPYLGYQEVMHLPGPAMLGAFEDMGWTLCANYPIPSLTQWGIIILGLCMGIIGIVAVRLMFFKTTLPG